MDCFTLFAMTTEAGAMTTEAGAMTTVPAQ